MTDQGVSKSGPKLVIFGTPKIRKREICMVLVQISTFSDFGFGQNRQKPTKMDKNRQKVGFFELGLGAKTKNDKNNQNGKNDKYPKFIVLSFTKIYQICQNDRK